jgi:VanZ family protein
MGPQRSVALHLAWVYALLLAYASLFPFEGWRWPAGAQWSELLPLQWPPWRSRFDEWSNLLGYVPLGMALFSALLADRRMPTWAAGILSLLGGALLSYALEFVQHFIPGRFPSLRDWANNTAGVAVGVLLAALLHALGWLRAGQRWRQRWSAPHSAPALVLLFLWPLGLMYPTPFPLGLGQMGWLEELRELQRALAEMAAALPGLPAGWGLPPDQPLLSGALDVQREAWVLATGLAAPCLLAGVVTRAGWRRWLLAPAVAAVAVGVMTLSTALNFGPDHALAWMTRLHIQALVATVLVCAALCLLGPRWCALFALVALVMQVLLVADAPSDPYYAASLQGWDQGRFIRFHGLAQLIGWVWPYATMVWLVMWMAGWRRRLRETWRA